MNDRDPASMPPIAPARDEVASRQQGGKRAAPSRDLTGGDDLVVRALAAVGLAVAVAVGIWAWLLQRELDATEPLMEQYESRIKDLEDRLSDTDEGMNQSAAVTAVKIKELTQEVDKLWASAWRRNKARLDQLEKGQAETSQAQAAQIKALADDVASLRAVAGDLQQLASGTKANQESIERLGDDLSRSALELAKLSKRVQSGEDWQGSVNNFRRQVNQSLLQLREQIAQLQGEQPQPPPPAATATLSPARSLPLRCTMPGLHSRHFWGHP